METIAEPINNNSEASLLRATLPPAAQVFEQAPRPHNSGRLPIKPSYSYEWDILDVRTFRLVGVIARRAPDGTPRFNFPQTVWLYPEISMNWSTRMNRQMRTLAVNILTPFLPPRTERVAVGTTSLLALEHAAPFARLFLCTMPREGGCIPRSVIQEWIRSTS
jgi:hypothetical protein